MKIFLTAKKGLGKSTVVEKFVRLYNKPINGFYITRMKDRSNNNQGFLAKTFDGRMEILSHKKLIRSDYIVGDNHNIDIDVVNNFLVPEIKKGLTDNSLLVIDEIGRMEALSESFLGVVREAVSSENNILATIVYEDEPWSLEFKTDPRVKLIEVTLENRDNLPNELLRLFN